MPDDFRVRNLRIAYFREMRKDGLVIDPDNCIHVVPWTGSTIVLCPLGFADLPAMFRVVRYYYSRDPTPSELSVYKQSGYTVYRLVR